jgi:hypothetical protein
MMVSAQPPGIAEYEQVDDMFVRVTDGTHRQSGFWITRETVATCSHGFESIQVGDALRLEGNGRSEAATVLAADISSDTVLLHSDHAYRRAIVPLGTDVVPGDDLYAYGCTSRNPEGESVTLVSEGWSRKPFHLKLKDGLVEPGMSGAALYSRRTREIVGMVRVSRNLSMPTGGRAVPAAAISEVAAGAGVIAGDPVITAATAADVPTILGIFEAAYVETRPIAAVEEAILSGTTEKWPEASVMQDAMTETLQHDEARRNAVKEWHAVWPSCLRFIVTGVEGMERRIGATCVLPLTHQAYLRYRAGTLREFELGKSDLADPAMESSRWLCFQSFALSSKGGAEEHVALRRTIVEHVLELAGAGQSPNVIAEIGTQAGLVEARYFGMQYCGLSVLKRPLFELDSTSARRWLDQRPVSER